MLTYRLYGPWNPGTSRPAHPFSSTGGFPASLGRERNSSRFGYHELHPLRFSVCRHQNTSASA